ncbi:unnamed protein product [Durusdinium trenchii]|uniref:Uncharacterized protein n=1 Tax=Durusdinium trenchii TaxID=1381693 RepID=A0ABP0QK90_9DINO
MVTTGAERQIPWIFQKSSEQTMMQMNLLNLSMSTSAVFRKMKLIDDDKAVKAGKDTGADNIDASSKKKNLAQSVKKDLSMIGLASAAPSVPGNDLHGEEGDEDDEQEATACGSCEPPCSTNPESLAKKQNLSGKKGAIKAKIFNGYHVDEVKGYTSFITAIDGSDEKREKTALDEAIGALQFIADMVAMSTPSGEARPKKRARKDKDCGERKVDGMLSTMLFCLGIFLEFAFAGEAVSNGKLFKVYSALRTELQQILLTASEQVLMVSANGGSQQHVDPIQVAKMLCATFASKPVSQIVFDDAEEANIKRVTTVMSLHRSDIVIPLTDFCKDKLHLPLMLMDYPMKTLKALSTEVDKSCIRNCMDLMAFLHKNLAENLPFSWFCFAQDVSDLITAKGHFVEKSEEVFKTEVTLEKFLSLRVKATMFILNEAVRNVPDFALMEESEECNNTLCSLHCLKDGSETFLSLSTCDILLSSKDWASTWALSLSQAKSMDDLADLMLEKLGLDKATILGRSKPPAPKTSEVSPPNASEKKEEAETKDGEGEGSSKNGGDPVPDADLMAKLDLEAVPLAFINDYQGCAPEGQVGLFADSIEGRSLQLKSDAFTGSFFKALQCKLECALWQYYSQVKEESVIINLAGKKTEAFIKLPIPSDLKLPFIGSVSQIKSKNALPLATLFGVPFFVESRGGEAQSSDVFVPAWTVKTVSKVDQAFLQVKTEQFHLLLWMPAGATNPNQICVRLKEQNPLQSAIDPAQELDSGIARYCSVEATLQSLRPLPDVNEKVQKGFELDQQRAEKTARGLVESAIKKKNKEAGSKKCKNALAGICGDLPEDPDKRAAAIDELIGDCDRIEEVIQNAIKQVKKPFRVPITKLTSEDRGGLRTKQMKDALAAAKKHDALKPDQDHADDKDDAAPAVRGVRAVLQDAETKGIKPKPKKAAKNSTGKDSNAKSTLVEARKLGKHLLK